MIRYTKPYLLLIIVQLLLSCASSDHTQQNDPFSAQKDDVANLISQLPAEDATENQWLFSKLVDSGPGGIQAVLQMLVPSGSGDDTYARFAVNGLTKYVTRPGAESERSMFEEIVLEELNSGMSKDVKVFLIKQLELAGSDNSIAILKNYLTDETLCEPAAQALISIGTVRTEEALLQSLSNVQTNQKAMLLKALGDLEVSSAAEVILPYAGSNDALIRGAALYALAGTGQPVAADILSEAVNAEQSYRQTTALSQYLLYARRLAEEGYVQQGADIARRIIAGNGAAHIKSAALYLLVQYEGDQAIKYLLAAAESNDPQLRGAALSLVHEVPDSTDTTAWINMLENRTPEIQADIIAMLGEFPENASIVPKLKPFLEHDDLHVRMATVQTVSVLGGSDYLPVLLEHLQRSSQTQEIETIRTSLLQLPSEELIPVLAKTLPASSDHVKTVLIKLLASRQAKDYFDVVASYSSHNNESVRKAALESIEALATPKDLPLIISLLDEAPNETERSIIQQAIASVSGNIMDPEKRMAPILQRLEGASALQKEYLLQTLPLIGTEIALNEVVKSAQSPDQAEKSAATEALASWPEPSAIPALSDVIRTSTGSVSPAVLNGFIRLVHTSKYSSDDKIRWLAGATESVNSPRQKATLLKSLSMIQTPEALKVIAGYFSYRDQSVRDAAVRSAASLLSSQNNGTDGLNSTTTALSIIETTVRPELSQQIEQQIREIRMREQEVGEFTSLFNGRDLTGWIGSTEGYYVEDGKIVSSQDVQGNLYTENEYSDFILRFEFKLTEGANNGLGIRTPLEGDAAYEGMELQILDNSADQYAGLEPYQYHGSVYGLVPARRGYLKPAGEWNTQEVIARNSHIIVKLNGETIVDADVEEAATPAPADGREHPGLKRRSGHIAFLGHGSKVEFRNIRIKDLTAYAPDYSLENSAGDGLNHPPEGFKALFNGQDLGGWKGLVDNPETRAEMTQQELDSAQIKADSLMRRHWSVRDGILYFDGRGSHLCTIEEYGDFEMLLDWKIEPGGDSGVYLRGSPQVQIWDVTEWPQGSGGLYNNQEHSANPRTPADNPIGEWNRMRIKMVGERVTVHLNGELVVSDVVMENYWNRDKPIYPVGQIELQSHNTPLYFRNIFIREIPRTEDLFNGNDLTGWERIDGEAGSWNVSNGILFTQGDGDEWQQGMGGGWLSTTEMYDNFKLELEYRISEGGNSGVFLRAPHEGDPAYSGLEIQILDDYAEQFQGLEPWQYTGSIYNIEAPSTRATKRSNEWQKMVIVCDGPKIKVSVNGEQIINTSLTAHMDRINEHPGLKRRKGYIGLQNHNTGIEFQNIKITELE